METSNGNKPGNANIIDDDILGGGETTPQVQTQQPIVQQVTQQQQFNQQPVQNNSSPIDLGFTFDTQPPKTQVNQPQFTQSLTNHP